MLRFLRRSEPLVDMAVDVEEFETGLDLELDTYRPPVRSLLTSDDLSDLSQDDFRFDGDPAAFVVAFISPNADFNAVTRRLQQMAGPARLIATTTAGGLCSQGPETAYCSTEGDWRTITLQVFSPRFFEKVEIFSVPLFSEDLRSGGAPWHAVSGLPKLPRL